MPERYPEPIQQNQEIVSRLLRNDLTLDPANVQRFYTSNIVNRVLAHLLGTDGSKSYMLQSTSAGILKVAPIGSGFENNDTKADTAADAYGTALAFDNTASRVDVFVYDNPAYIKRSSDGVTFDDQIEISADSFYSFDAVTAQINIKNKNAGDNARYVIVGWY